jgi:hypothetical protein
MLENTKPKKTLTAAVKVANLPSVLTSRIAFYLMLADLRNKCLTEQDKSSLRGVVVMTSHIDRQCFGSKYAEKLTQIRREALKQLVPDNLAWVLALHDKQLSQLTIPTFNHAVLTVETFRD